MLCYVSPAPQKKEPIVFLQENLITRQRDTVPTVKHGGGSIVLSRVNISFLI